MSTEVFFGDEAQQKLFDGMEKVFKAVSVTLGSRGRNAVYRRWGRPLITNDGVSIARKIMLADKSEAMGADLIKEAAERTNDEAGDGTTTATILTYYLISEGKKVMKEHPEYTPMELRQELEVALTEALDLLTKSAIQIQSDQDLFKIAFISAEDADIAQLVAESVKKVGSTGRVVAEESQGFTIEKEEVPGMEIEGGYTSPYFITHQDKAEAILNNPYVLVTNKTFTFNNDIFPLMKEMTEKGFRELVLVCQDIQSEALATAVQNKVKGQFTIVGVKAPRSQEMLEDLAAFCGKNGAITDEKYTRKVDFSQLVRIRKVVASKDKTLFVKGDRTDNENSYLNVRVTAIQELLKTARGDDKTQFEDRLARLTSSVIVIKSGAPTEAEMIYLRLKIEDAIHAVKAALKEGYVAGGGITLRWVAGQVNETLKTRGSALLALACGKPIEILVRNTGVAFEPDKINQTDGFDTDSGHYVANIAEAGIIDPVLVSKNALKHAVSLASMFLTVDTLIVDKDIPAATQ